MQVCEDLKIQSQNDEKKLEEAKGLVYLKGFTDGVMIVGAHAGQPVSVAKPLIRQELLAAGAAVAYAEPEGRVMSRSGDECVVALTDQWYAPACLRAGCLLATVLSEHGHGQSTVQTEGKGGTPRWLASRPCVLPSGSDGSEQT